MSLAAGALLAVSVVAAATPAAALEGQPTVVSLTFDDSNADQMAAVDIMNANGLDGTFYTLSGFIGAPGYQTQADLTAIAAAGHEIGGHTVTHPDMATLDAAEAERQACENRATLASWGFQVTSFAYPFASLNATAKAAVEACGYNSARNLGDIETRFGCTGCGFAESIPPADPFELRVPDQVESTWTLADLQNTVANAENTTGGWVAFTFHHICDNCDVEGLNVTPAVFQAFSAWLAARPTTHNTSVQTVHQVVGGTVKPIVAAELPPAPGPGVNGVANPGLEIVGADGVPSCWITAGFGANAPTFTTLSPGRTGNVAEQLVMANHVDGDAKLIFTMDFGTCAPSVTAGHRYSLRAWYRSDALTQFAVYLRNAVGAWSYWTSSPYFAASPGYVQAVWDSDVIPAGSTGISFGLNLFGNGTLVTDDYALYDLVGAPGVMIPATPTITGVPTVGSTLTASPGAWAPPTTTFTQQWLRNGTAIAGATAPSYVLVAADSAATISVRVTGSAPGFSSESAVSAGIAIGQGAVAPGTPTIAGTARVGSLLTANAGAWTPAGVVLAHQWLRNGVAIAGATAASYTPVVADLGTTLQVRVTGSLAGYTSATATSAPTAAVQNSLISVNRLFGADRYATAIAIAKSYAPGVARVYVATGTVFADALSAAPAAAHFSSPMLLTSPTELRSDVRAEIARLAPAEIVVVGGPASVAESIVTALRVIAPTSRISGADRYATSRAIAAEAFEGGAGTAFLATGTNFPDALSAAPAASRFGGPTILVPGTAPSLDGATRALIDALGVSTVKIAGGLTVVTAGIATSADATPGVTSVQRLAGADRYATAAAINADAFDSAVTSYLAVGTGFPDALVGAALAGWKGGPLYLTPTACLATAAVTGIGNHGSTNVTLFGGVGVLGTNVANLVPCPSP